tara:strand:- start:736 stop:1188 length:453 start_codon:yes stop_codon:yes gene_type:complete
VTKEQVLEALKPLCRFTSAFVTQEEISSEDTACFCKHPDHVDPPLFGINGKGLARLTAITHGFWLRRSQVARFNIERNTRCRPATDVELQRALALAASKVDCNAGEELTSQARVCFSYYTMFILSFLVLTTCNVDDSDCKADAQTNIGRL